MQICDSCPCVYLVLITSVATTMIHSLYIYPHKNVLVLFLKTNNLPGAMLSTQRPGNILFNDSCHKNFFWIVYLLCKPRASAFMILVLDRLCHSLPQRRQLCRCMSITTNGMNFSQDVRICSCSFTFPLLPPLKLQPQDCANLLI